MEKINTRNQTSGIERELAEGRYLFGKSGKQVPLSQITPGQTRLRFSGSPEFDSKCNPDPEYIDPDAPDAGEVRVIKELTPPDFVVLCATQTKGEYANQVDIIRKYSQVLD